MITNLWMDHRKDNWARLDALLRQAETSGVRTLDPASLRDLGLLYRQTAADLSAVRADRSARALEHYLNTLVGRAHNFVYSGGRTSLGTVWRFLAHGYPRLLRRLSRYVVAATSVVLLAGILGALVTALRPDFATIMLPAELLDKVDHHVMWTDAILSAKPQASSGIMTNNISVCFLTFAAGITAGLGTLWLLFTNGLSIGVILVVCARHHMLLNILGFMAAHGALELPAIMIAGAAGLRLGAGILFPGLLLRRDSVALAGSEAVQLISGTIPMLVVAGTLEAFLSPTSAPLALKFSVCAVLFVGLLWWLSAGGRQGDETSPATA